MFPTLRMPIRALVLSPILPLVFWPPLCRAAEPIQLRLDAREAPRKILHAHLSFPVKAGKITLVYPKWIPGEHAPSGPINELAGLKFSAGGKSLPWKRDPVDMFAFQVEVPSGATLLEADLDFLLAAKPEGFSSGASATAELAAISWNQALIYPAGMKSDDVIFAASLRLPEGWKFATALKRAKESPDGTEFAPVPLTTLVDSPVLAGAFFRSVRLNEGKTPPVYLDLVADGATALGASDDWLSRYRRLAAEAVALFGATHYTQYHFLVTLSDGTAHFGLEHHESSDDRMPERGLIDPDLQPLSATLLPHEMVHSWNGKYRRPADLLTSDYQQPMQTSLLWVYEGLTQYLGCLLTARSGLWTPESYREQLAAIAAKLDYQRGRSWRSLSDTAVAAQLLYDAGPQWSAWRRQTDFYNEGWLIWLETDAIIRTQSRGQRSLDDFCRRFHGGESGPPGVVPYQFSDLVDALRETVAYDWESFFTERLGSTGAHAPLGGIENSGWQLVYDGQLPALQKLGETANKLTDLTFSLGFQVKEDGNIIDVIPESPAARAGIGPGMNLLAVNNRRWSREILREALKEAVTTRQPISLLLENAGYFKSYSLPYFEGEKYPHLIRAGAKDDLLTRMISPLARER